MKLNWMVATLTAIALTCPGIAAYADDTAPAPAAKPKRHSGKKEHAIASPAVSVAGIPANFADKWVGTYRTDQNNFVTVKRLTFSKEKDGSLKIHGALVGFPEEVSIGDAVAEPYADRNSKDNPDVLLASFASDRFKPLMVLTGGFDGVHMVNVNFTCYMTDVDGSKVHIAGNLRREP